FLNKESERLGGEKVPPMPWGHFSPRFMTVDARIVHKWVPKIWMEDFKVRFSSFLINFFESSEQPYRRVMGRGEG
ncbi:MAG: hypothetical protein AAFV95_29600, partial [Bacteroidota bacterium]